MAALAPRICVGWLDQRGYRHDCETNEDISHRHRRSTRCESCQRSQAVARKSSIDARRLRKRKAAGAPMRVAGKSCPVCCDMPWVREDDRFTESGRQVAIKGVCVGCGERYAPLPPVRSTDISLIHSSAGMSARHGELEGYSGCNPANHNKPRVKECIGFRSNKGHQPCPNKSNPGKGKRCAACAGNQELWRQANYRKETYRNEKSKRELVAFIGKELGRRTCIGYDTEQRHVACGGPLMSDKRSVKRCPTCGIKQEKFNNRCAWQRQVERRKTMGEH